MTWAWNLAIPLLGGDFWMIQIKVIGAFFSNVSDILTLKLPNIFLVFMQETTPYFIEVFEITTTS